MRLAVFADIHANFEALQAVVADFKDQQIDRYICLGDLIGYGANPNECIELVRSLPNVIVLLGNHDAAATWGTTPFGMSKAAQQVIFWSMEILTEKSLSFIKTLEATRVMGDMIFSHANPYNPKAWRYVNSRKYAARTFSQTGERLVFIGHTHRPMVITRKNFFQMSFEEPDPSTIYTVTAKNRQIYNCGSVGQPRDGQPLACYLIYDTRSQQLTYRRIAYDHQKSAAKILDAGLPAYLANRLAKGR
ncbi:MAG: metallophosphoesterase [Desulfobulbaceae bacterium]|nr:metallophosphoesterase [Desulfobulbaceae bacterium]